MQLKNYLTHKNIFVNYGSIKKVSLCKDCGYKKLSGKNSYLYKNFEDKSIQFFKQRSFTKYMNNKNINIFRHPDEAYIIKYKN